MPFYEYECPACKFYTEVLQKISDKPLKKCPSCGAPKFKRLVSAPVFRLKGSGWYETDFKSDKDGQRNLAGAERAEAAPAADAKAKPDDKAAAKPAADATASKPEAAQPRGKTLAAGRKAAAKPSRSPRPPAKPAARRSAKRTAAGARHGKGRR